MTAIAASIAAYRPQATDTEKWSVPPNDVRSGPPGFEKNLITHTSNATAPSTSATIAAGNGRVTLSANRSTAHTARITRASRNTSFAPSPELQPLPLALLLREPAPPGSETLAVAVYQLKNTLISSTNAPPAEIQTDRGTAATSKLAAGAEGPGADAVDSAAGRGGGGGGGVGAGSGSGSGVGSGAVGGGSAGAADSVGVGSGTASSPAVGPLPSVLMGPPLTTACGCSRPSTTQNVRAREIPVEVPPGEG